MKKLSMFLLTLAAVGMVMAQAELNYPDKMYLVGSGSGAGWSAENAIEMTTTAEGVYTLTARIYGHNNEEQFNEFKFLSKQSFADYPQVGPVVKGDEFNGEGTYTAAMFHAEEEDSKYHNMLTETALYGFTLNLKDSTLSVEKLPEVCDRLYMIGEAVGGWNFNKNSIELTGEDSIFTYTGAIKDGELKFTQEKNFESLTWGATEDSLIIAEGTNDLQRQDGTDHKFIMSAKGEIRLTINLKTQKMEYTILKEEVDPEVCDRLYMIGEAVGGWNFDENSIELIGEDSIFTYTGAIKDGELKFTQEKNFESLTWGATEDSLIIAEGTNDLQRQDGTDHKFIMTAYNEIMLTINLKTQTLTYEVRSPQGVENVYDNDNDNANVNKVLRNGKLYILNHEEVFTTTGVRVK